MPDDSFAYTCRDRRRATGSTARVMRHFSFLPLTVGLLTMGMSAPPATRLLVATAGRNEGLAPRSLTAPTRAVAMPTVAPRADVDHHTTAVAHVTAAIRTALHDPGLDKGLDSDAPLARYSSPGVFHPRPHRRSAFPLWISHRRFSILPPTQHAHGALTRAMMMLTPGISKRGQIANMPRFSDAADTPLS